MVRILTVLILSLLIPQPAVAQKRKSDREHEGLIGRVKTVQVEKAEFSNRSGSWAQGRRSLFKKAEYDAAGNLLQEVTPGLFPYHVYGYDSGGNRLERNSRALYTTRPPSTSDFGFANELNHNFTYYRWSFKHDAEGNRIEEAKYRRRGRLGLMTLNLVEKTTHLYDRSSRRIETSQFSPSGRLVRRWRYTYDDLGNVSELAEVSADNAVKAKEYYTYVFDPAGNWVKRTATQWIGQGSRSVLVPVEVTYRTIAYH